MIALSLFDFFLLFFHQENAVNGEHLWVDTNASGDFCYVGETECSVCIICFTILETLSLYAYNIICIYTLINNCLMDMDPEDPLSFWRFLV